jgi:hypothetical protein
MGLLDEKEDLLEIDRESIFGPVRHGGGFMPDDLISENPSSVDHHDSETSGNLQQTLLGQICPRSNRRSVLGGLMTLRLQIGTPPACAAVPRRVGISQIDPTSSCGLEHSLDLIEHRAEPFKIVLKSRLKAKLHCDAVVAQCPVRRASDDAIEAVGWQLLKDVEGVATEDAIDERLESGMHESGYKGL